MESGSAARGPFLRVKVNHRQGKAMRVVDFGENGEGFATNVPSGSLKVPDDNVARGGEAHPPALFSPGLLPDEPLLLAERSDTEAVSIEPLPGCTVRGRGRGAI